MATYVIKLDLSSDIRRVALERLPSLSELKELASSLYKSNLSKNFVFKYYDDDEDLITVTSDLELSEAFRIKKETSMRFIVIPLEQVKETVVQKEAPIPEKETHSEQQKGEDLLPLHNAICDVCKVRIRGTRWRCRQCPDYDLCSVCKEDKAHAFHKFARIEKRRKKKQEDVPNEGELMESFVAENPKDEGEQKEETHRGEELQREEEVSFQETPKEEEPKEQPQEEVVSEEKPKEEVVSEEKPKEEPKEENQPKEDPNKNELPFQSELNTLRDMGFGDREKNLLLLTKHKGDVASVIGDLLG